MWASDVCSEQVEVTFLKAFKGDDASFINSRMQCFPSVSSHSVHARGLSAVCCGLFLCLCLEDFDVLGVSSKSM